jgi:hypothetical protein
MTDEIFKQAVDRWGSDLQIVVAIEELAELQKELCKSLRGNGDTEAISEEMADVKLMLSQLEYIFKNSSAIELWINIKTRRLQRILPEAKQ